MGRDSNPAPLASKANTQPLRHSLIYSSRFTFDLYREQVFRFLDDFCTFSKFFTKKSNIQKRKKRLNLSYSSLLFLLHKTMKIFKTILINYRHFFLSLCILYFGEKFEKCTKNIEKPKNLLSI